jgi:hypothetical protein
MTIGGVGSALWHSKAACLEYILAQCDYVFWLPQESLQHSASFVFQASIL